MDTLTRIKVLINSSTPIIVMETVEEARALALLRAACCDLALPLFEWSIADGLVRNGSAIPAPGTVPAVDPDRTTATDLGQRIAAAKQKLAEAGLSELDFSRRNPHPPVPANQTGET
ncbi:MAG TPA: hypothetical protein VLA96_10775, partial [Terriglobales bacterium]|nr:hypothetical protein [Terriglobales bacterium]